MALAGYQFPRAFGVSFGTSAAHKAPTVQEEPQQTQVRITQVTAQREVVAQPALLHESTRRSQRTQGTVKLSDSGLAEGSVSARAIGPYLAAQD
jgi:hypothetical protein